MSNEIQDSSESSHINIFDSIFAQASVPPNLDGIWIDTIKHKIGSILTELHVPDPAFESIDKQFAVIKDNYLRLLAEYDNLKKRITREYDQMVQTANEETITDIIDIYDDLGQALKSEMQTAGHDEFIKGLAMITDRFIGMLKKFGVKAFGQRGDLFDPEFHSALKEVADPNISRNHITEVCRQGYLLNGKVIKHAQVTISSGFEDKIVPDITAY